MAERPNVYTTEWQRSVDQGSYGLRGTQVGLEATKLGATVYELDPGKRNLPYHAHFAVEEMIVVLRGTPTLRTPEGERELAEGEVVALGTGRASAHQVINRTDDVVRFLIVSTKADADLIEYPDSQKISAQAGRWGTPDAVAYMLAMEPQVGYFEGEPE